MSNVISFHPKKSTLINLYEVVGEDGNAIWGGNDPMEAIRWYLRERGLRVLVSGWESDDEDAHLIGQPIDITPVIVQALREQLI